jgi:membrane-associated protease RseP (regulator of RpoE activity)
VSPQDYLTAPAAPPSANGVRAEAAVARWRAAVPRTRPRYWLHVLLFAMTLFATCVVGAGMQRDFDRNLPFSIENAIEGFFTISDHPSALAAGLPFALTLLTILLAHEFGHYCAALYYGVDASLPYFLPSPVFGTFGAFIRIRSPIYSKRALFDIGIAGPLAGFIALIPALGVGIAFSKVIPGIAAQGSITFGTPALLWLAQQAVFPGVPASDIYLHPIARAAWVGLFATALNLLPIGQLDGGHILYALWSRRHRAISLAAIALLAPLYHYWPGWLLWAAILFLLRKHHPVIYDAAPAGGSRLRLGLVALAIFALSFTVAPVVSQHGL